MHDKPLSIIMRTSSESLLLINYNTLIEHVNHHLWFCLFTLEDIIAYKRINLPSEAKSQS